MMESNLIEVLVVLVLVQAPFLSAWLWIAYKRMEERRRYLEESNPISRFKGSG